MFHLIWKFSHICSRDINTNDAKSMIRNHLFGFKSFVAIALIPYRVNLLEQLLFRIIYTSRRYWWYDIFWSCKQKTAATKIQWFLLRLKRTGIMWLAFIAWSFHTWSYFIIKSQLILRKTFTIYACLFIQWKKWSLQVWNIAMRTVHNTHCVYCCTLRISRICSLTTLECHWYQQQTIIS